MVLGKLIFSLLKEVMIKSALRSIVDNGFEVIGATTDAFDSIEVESDEFEPEDETQD